MKWCRQSDGGIVNPYETNLLTHEQGHLLAELVATASQPSFDDSEPFLAIRVGLAGVTILHHGVNALSLSEMRDLDYLAYLEFIELRRMPSGARLFRITGTGFSRARSGLPAQPNPNDHAGS